MEKFWFVLEDATSVLIEGWEGRHWSCEEDRHLAVGESFGGVESSGGIGEAEFVRDKFAKSTLTLAASFFSSKNGILGDFGDWLQDGNHFTSKTWKTVSKCCRIIRRNGGDTDFVTARASKNALSVIATNLLDDFEITVDPMASTGAFSIRSKSYASEERTRKRGETRALLTREEQMKDSTKEEKHAYLLEVANALVTSKKAMEAVDRRDMEFIEALEKMEELTDPKAEEYVELATGFKEKHHKYGNVGND
ncbi:hypothetical protein TrRE_jg5967, partial [Triparma retinervis]